MEAITSRTQGARHPRKVTGVFGRGAVVALTTGLAACITVNIYFPAPEVRAAAEEIVEETWGGVPSAAETPEPGAALLPPGGVGNVLLAALERLYVADAHAAGDKPDINVSTAAIRTIKEAMRKRAAELKPYLASGNLGVGNDGMLVVRNMDGVALRDQATIRRLVEAENGDRRSLYSEIATANDFGSDRVPEIASIFAETWIDKAEPGWWVQASDGRWRQR